MRIGRIRLSRVGPLRDRIIFLEPGLNLIYGRNEAGKTALVDFLVSQLFRREGRRGTRLATVMRGVDRFSETREGEVELHLDGEVLVYPEAPSLLRELDLGYSGLSGLFCVRSGEMEWPEKEEGDFWAALKKLLSGLPEGVETLRQEAHAVGGLTETGQRMNREDRPLLDRYREARERARRLEGLRELLPQARQREESIARLERALDRMDRARRARIAELHDRVQTARRELEEIPEVEREQLERWRELAVREREARERIEELEETVAEAREARREEEKKAARIEAEASEAGSRRDRIRERRLGERARERLGAGAGADEGPEGFGAAEKLVAATGVALPLALVAASLAGLVAWPVAVLGALAGAGAAAWLGMRRRASRRRDGERERAARDLVSEGREMGLEVDSLEEIPGAVDAVERRAAEAGEAHRVQQVELRHAEERTGEEEEELARVRDRLEELAEAREAVGADLGAEDLSEAEARHSRREDLRGRISELESALTELAGPDPDDRQVDRPEEAEDLPEWDAERRSRLERELEETRREYRELRDRFVEVGLATPEDALTELEECRRVMAELERDWRAARLAGAIFGQMDESLERGLTEVLEAEGPFSAGAVIRRVTRERYVAVARREGEGLSVRDEQGRRYPVADLSRGTRDQVYLALRIALGEAALESAGLEGGGFFLLDDPFLTADWTRRERLVETGAELAGAGWQLVYLTCDDHLRDLFVEAGATLHELD